MEPAADRAQHEEIARRAVEAWNASDWRALEAMVSDDVVAIGPRDWPEAGVNTGWPAVRGQFERLKEPWSEERFEVDSITAVGPGALVHGRWLGRGEGSGLELDLETWVLYSIDGGDITRMQFFNNAAEVERAVGEAGR